MTARRFACDKCGWVSYPPPHIKILFHPCRGTGDRRRLIDWLQKPGLEEQAEQDRIDWFTSNYPTPSPKGEPR